MMSDYTMAFFGAAPFGSLLGGMLAERVGAPHTVIITGVFCIAGSLWFTLKLPGVIAGMQPVLLHRLSFGIVRRQRQLSLHLRKKQLD